MNRRTFLTSVPFASRGRRVGRGTAAKAANTFVYVGTNTHSRARGIYAYRFQPSSGKVTPIAWWPRPRSLLAHGASRPSYSTRVNELNSSASPAKANNISSFTLDRTSGKLTF